MRRVFWLYVISSCNLVYFALADNKYFHEPGEDDLHHHYDTRYFKDLVSDQERQLSLTALIRAYSLLFTHLELQTWIAHGTLLGWFWQGRILSWDWDLDAQVTNATLHVLAQEHNNTYHAFYSPQLNLTRTYHLDINAWSWERVRGDSENIIDGRFIDTSNGMFLDITGLTINNAAEPDVLECKNEHRYNISDIFPLRESCFEGVHVKVPFAYTQILAEEYSPYALCQTTFHNHTFNPIEKEWQQIVEVLAEEDIVAPLGGAFS